MPGFRLEAAAKPVPRFSVVGSYARPMQDQFVGHVALLQDGDDLAFEGVAEVWHCGPPIVAGQQTAAQLNEQCDAHAVSFLDDLSANDIAGIETTLAEIDAQTQPASTPTDAFRQYVVHPPVFPVMDEKTGRVRCRKFSCVGFVLECYLEGADVRLLDNEFSKFPAVDLETLASAYGDTVRNKKRRERYGIVGDGPSWQIMLAGYVMHSLNRPSDVVRVSPHVPTDISEAEFPLQNDPGSGQPADEVKAQGKKGKFTSESGE